MNNRFIGGALFVVVITAVMLLRNVSLYIFDGFVLFLAIVGAFEMARALKNNLDKRNFACVTIFICAILPTYYLLGGMIGLYKLFFLYFFASAILSIFYKIPLKDLINRTEPLNEAGVVTKQSGLKNLSSAVMVGIYPIMMFAFFIDINHWATMSTPALLLIFLVGPFCDVMAYAVGSTVKGPKLFPSVSPKKTISGAIGGVVGGVAGAIVVYFVSRAWFASDVGGGVSSLLFFIIFGVIGSGLTELGDLVESSIKRSLGIKDMGNIIPGHGGILDRFDGVLFVVFATYIYFDMVMVYMQ